MSKRFLLLIILSTSLILWNMLNFSGILFGQDTIYKPIGNFLFSNVCHLQQNKLLFINEIPTILCSRCTGIYFGALLTSSILLFIDIRKTFNFKQLIFFSIPTILDITFYNLNIYNYYFPISFLAGVFLGIFGFYYFYIGILNLITNKRLLNS